MVCRVHGVGRGRPWWAGLGNLYGDGASGEMGLGTGFLCVALVTVGVVVIGACLVAVHLTRGGQSPVGASRETTCEAE